MKRYAALILFVWLLLSGAAETLTLAVARIAHETYLEARK